MRYLSTVTVLPTVDGTFGERDWRTEEEQGNVLLWTGLTAKHILAA